MRDKQRGKALQSLVVGFAGPGHAGEITRLRAGFTGQHLVEVESSQRMGEAAATEPMMKLTPGRFENKWLSIDYLDVEHRDRRLRYAATGSSPIKRTKSLFTKEPITLAWIDTFDEGEMLFDIGANVGIYTIYAAVMRKAHVRSFEPEALNFAELNKNIFLNDLHGRVLAYCLALTDADKVDVLHLSDFGLGISYHDFEENSWTGDKTFAADWVAKRDQRRLQGCVGFALDSLIDGGMEPPAHIKIDVDGLEHRVVAGMRNVLQEHDGLKTVLIEINFDSPKNLEIIDTMLNLGWKFSWDQLRCHRKVIFSVDQIERYQKRGEGGLNYIFYRDDSYTNFFAEFLKNYVPPLAARVQGS
jgi:FkbM family methyltransferase